jgi:sugar phosphate isomerase/epimerase
VNLIGIFAKTFPRPTPGENLDAIRSHGLTVAQYNLACAGLPSLPERIEPALAQQIGAAAASRRIAIAAVSGTFNMIDPIRERRDAGMRRLGQLAGACALLGTKIITLCTGTRDPDDMWRDHPANARPDAWADLLAAMDQAIAIAEEHDLWLAVEPETANVVDSPVKARRLLGELGSPHAKDVRVVGGTVHHVAAGTGVLDYRHYLKLLRQSPVPLIVHGLAEAEVEGALAFLRGALAAVQREAPAEVR